VRIIVNLEIFVLKYLEIFVLKYLEIFYFLNLIYKIVNPILDRLDNDARERGIPTLLHNFFNVQDDTTYNALLTGIIAAKNANKSISGIRYLVFLADGTTAIDTGTKTANTPENFKDKVVNESHGTRLAISTSLLSSAGTGEEVKWSTSTGQFERYYSVRHGRSAYDAMGGIRYSFKE